LAIKFSGDFSAPRSPEEVYSFLSDPNKFASLLPEFQGMTVQDPTHFTVKVGVGVGNIRGSAEIKMELAEATRPTRALYKGQGSAVGSQITISAGFDLAPEGDGTKVSWQGEANIFGKLASMAGGMLEPLGRKNIQKLIDSLRWSLTRPQATAEVVPQEEPQPPAPPEALAAQPLTPSEVSAIQPSPAETAGPDTPPAAELNPTSAPEESHVNDHAQ
jgi:hypothetical protein